MNDKGGVTIKKNVIGILMFVLICVVFAAVFIGGNESKTVEKSYITKDVVLKPTLEQSAPKSLPPPPEKFFNIYRSTDLGVLDKVRAMGYAPDVPYIPPKLKPIFVSLFIDKHTGNMYGLTIVITTDEEIRKIEKAFGKRLSEVNDMKEYIKFLREYPEHSITIHISYAGMFRLKNTLALARDRGDELIYIKGKIPVRFVYLEDQGHAYLEVPYQDLGGRFDMFIRTNEGFAKVYNYSRQEIRDMFIKIAESVVR